MEVDEVVEISNFKFSNPHRSFNFKKSNLLFSLSSSLLVKNSAIYLDTFTLA